MSTYGLIPDGTGWVDAYGRTWTAQGGDMVLWDTDSPYITILGNNPVETDQFEPYTDAGATAVDAEGVDLTGDIVTVSDVDINVAGPYTVTYTVTDQFGYQSEAVRDVNVIDADQPAVRDWTFRLLDAAMPDGVQVYETPPEQIKAPAVSIGTMSWVPFSMASLDRVEWEMTIDLMTARSRPDYSIIALETFSVTVAKTLLAGGYRIVGFEDIGTQTIGGTDYLVGTLTVQYKEDT